jgi:hypothetical protein
MRRSMWSAYRIFETAERLELLCAAIYEALAEQFADDARAHDLFARLHAEELQHAQRVRLLSARYRHDKRLLDRPAADPDALEGLLAEGDAVLVLARSGGFGRDLDRARAALADLELKFEQAHAQALAREANPALREFFELLARQDAAHRELLGK